MYPTDAKSVRMPRISPDEESTFQPEDSGFRKQKDSNTYFQNYKFLRVPTEYLACCRA